MTSDATDYDLILKRVKRDEVLVSVKNVYRTNWKMAGTVGKLQTIAWFVIPYLPIIIYGIWLIYAGQYLYLFALPIIYFCILLANGGGINLVSLAPLILLFVLTVVTDSLFQTHTILISTVAGLSYALAVMSLYQVVQNAIENAVASKEWFQKLYDAKVLEIYEKTF